MHRFLADDPGLRYAQLLANSSPRSRDGRGLASRVPRFSLMLGFDAKRLGWALDIVHSRSLTVDMGRDDPRGVRRFLIPLVDFLNHSPDEGGAFFFALAVSELCCCC